MIDIIDAGRPRGPLDTSPMRASIDGGARRSEREDRASSPVRTVNGGESGLPKRFLDLFGDVQSFNADVCQHPIIELTKLPALLCASVPDAKQGCGLAKR